MKKLMNTKNNTSLFLVFFTFIISFTQNYQAFGQEIEKKQNLVDNDSIHPKDIEKNYNLWSVNLNAGTSIGVRPFTEGYYATTPNYLKNPSIKHVDLNVRKMFNTSFGVLWDFSYDNFSAETGSPAFSNNLYRTTVQGVLNLHRAFNWQDFTETFGVQVHAGPGLSFLEAPESKNFSGYDNIFSVVGGATLLIRASDKLAFNADYTIVSNLTHHRALDGQSKLDPSLSRTGIIYTASIGMTYYFGKKDRHADWYWENKKNENEELLARIKDLETMMNDMDKDGVPDYLDVQNNTLAGVAVDTKGRAVDINNNGVPDEIESFINNTYNAAQINNNNTNFQQGDTAYSNAQMRNMINGQYVNVFFDFDETRVTTGTISAINFLILYLNANPNAKAEVIGYADEFGNFDYNMNLSRRRAEKVTEMIVRSGIDAKRLKVVVKGEDNSVPKESKLARQLVRRVTFKVD